MWNRIHIVCQWMNNNYEQNENKHFQGDKSFSVNKSSSLKMWYCRLKSKVKDDASTIEIIFKLGIHQISSQFG